MKWELRGMSQAAYHGVPVVALPFFGDQTGNAGQAVARVCTSGHLKCMFIMKSFAHEGGS